jgi:hypothetical protein
MRSLTIGCASELVDVDDPAPFVDRIDKAFAPKL